MLRISGRLPVAFWTAGCCALLLSSCNGASKDREGTHQIQAGSEGGGALEWQRATGDDSLTLFSASQVAAIKRGEDPLQLTGDALTDRLLSLCEEGRDNDDLLESARETLSSGFSSIVAWESDFREDPRYWHLRYMWAWHQDVSEEVPFDEQVQVSEAAMRDQLTAAIDCGAVDMPILVTLWSSLNRDQTPNTERKDELLETMRAFSPDSAWPHYLVAYEHLRSGEYAQAEAEFKTGNSRKLLESLAMCPSNELFDRVSNGQLLGNAYASYGIYCLVYMTPVVDTDPGWILFNADKPLRTDVDNISLSLMTNINAATMRIALEGPPHRASTIEVMCSGYPRKLVNVYRASTQSVPWAAQPALDQLEKTAELLSQTSSDLVTDGTKYIEKVSKWAEEDAPSTSTMMIYLLENLYQDLRFTEDRYRPWFRALQEVDLTDLQPSPALDRLIQQPPR